jgi:hypothetical protein
LIDVSLLIAWAFFPLVLGLASLGCGKLLGRLTGVELPLALLIPSGFAVIIVVAGLATGIPATARTATPLVVGLAVAGLCFLPRRRPGTEARVAVAVGITTFLIFGAPVLFSGEATFSGYIKLDDTATFLAFADHALDHGRDLSMLEPSTYEATLTVNVANGYPLGAVLPLGIGARLVGSDPAWVWQPFISFAAALLSMTLYALAAGLVPGRARRACVAVLGASSALLYGYALWGGVKEVIAAALLALCAATLTHAVHGGARAALIPATACAAFLGVMSLGGIVWLLPLAVAILFSGPRGRARRTAVFCAPAAILAAPALTEAAAFLRPDNMTSFRAAEELGNLVRPLRLRQVMGIWPTGDFRVDPTHHWLTSALVVVAIVGLVLGVERARRRRAHATLLLGGAVALGVVVFVAAGSPWLGGKALAIASPIALFLAACGYAANLGRGGSPVWPAGMALLIVGVCWSNALAYREVWLAPRDQLEELELIGERFAGQGPALMTEYQPYGVRHFLRRLDAEGASELRRRAVRLRDGVVLAKGQHADLDEFRASEIDNAYRVLVLRRSPVASRPSSRYELAARGTWYDVWRRLDGVVGQERIPLGSALDPLGAAPCQTLQRLAKSGGRIVTPTVRHTAVAGFAAVPAGWVPSDPDSGIVTPTVGAASLWISVPAHGTYGVWVGGSFRGTVRTTVDNAPGGSLSSHLNAAGMWVRTGLVELTAGQHLVTVALSPSQLRPGNGGKGFSIGPVALAQEPSGALETQAAINAVALCGTQLDWIETTAG